MATIGSLEVVVLQRNSCLICETIVNCADIVWFANRITEEVFLTSQAKSSILRTTGISDFEKCSRLISAVETQVKVAPSKYSKFISILQEEPVMQSVVTVLSESYELQSKMQKAPLLLKQLSQGSTQSVTSSNSSGRASPSTVGMSIPELAGELALLITDLVELLDKYDGALGRMKVALENLVLPLSLKKLVHVVRSQDYKEATSVQELFKLLAPYWSCIDCNLLRVIVRASGCQAAIERLDKFLHHRSAISPSLVLYSPVKANFSELSKGDIKNDTSSDRNEPDRVIVNQPIQSPAKSSMEESQCTSIPNQPTEEKSDLKKESSVKVEAKVDTDILTLKDYDEKMSLLCGVLRLPRFALSYLRLATGCVLLTWEMSVDLVQYVQSVQLTDSDLQLLAKHGFSYINIANSYHIAIPNSSSWKTNKDDEPCSEEVGENLLEACKAGNLDTVFCHLDSGVDVNFKNSHGETALILASSYGHGNIVEVLLNSHASVDLKDVEWHTALHTASYYGNVGIVHMLLQAGADANIVNKFGNTALLVASYKDHWKIVSTLLNAGADMNVENMAGKTACDVAVECEHWQIVEMLMQAETKQSELLAICQCGDFQAVQYLLQNGADPNCHNEEGWTPLMLACSKGHVHIVNMLINNDAHVNLQNKNGVSALMIACSRGEYAIVQLLLNNNAYVNLQALCGETALGYASKYGDTDTVALLVKAGADLNLYTLDGLSPLMLASKRGHAEIVELLIENQANLEAQKYGVTALMCAVIFGKMKVIRLLVQGKANLNIQDQEAGWTALMLAAEDGNMEAVKLLISAGADVNIRDKNGLTAADIAKAGGHSDVYKELMVHATSQQVTRHTEDSVEENKRKARILQTTNLLNTLMQALEYKVEMLTSENTKKGIASVEDIIKGHQEVYPVIQPPLRITKDPERKLSVSSNETDLTEEKESSSKETK